MSMTDNSSATALATVAKCPKTDKRSFKAKLDAEKFEEENRTKYGNAHQYAYACEECPDWHLTSKPPGTDSMAKSHLGDTAPPPRSTDHTGPKGIDTAEVVQLKASGLTYQQIANRLDVSVPTVGYHLKKANGAALVTPTSVRQSKHVISLEGIFEEEERLQAQLERVRLEKERLLEATRMKVEAFGDKFVIKKNGEQVTLTSEDVVALIDFA